MNSVTVSMTTPLEDLKEQGGERLSWRKYMLFLGIENYLIAYSDFLSVGYSGTCTVLIIVLLTLLLLASNLPRFSPERYEIWNTAKHYKLKRFIIKTK